MLPTPSTSHVAFERVYEPAEDSFLLLDTLSSENERAFLKQRFSPHNFAGGRVPPAPFIVEIGTGSGVVLSFIHAHATAIFGRADVLTAGVDANRYACEATVETIRVVEQEQEQKSHAFCLGNLVGDLGSPLKAGIVDVLIFNPPYVPTPNLPALPKPLEGSGGPTFEGDSKLLELSYAGGADGMETTDRLLDTLPEMLSKDIGCAYVLLCAQNKPEDIKQRLRSMGAEWRAETVGRSGKKGGWEKLQIVRIWRRPTKNAAQ
jgi:release factor glutamine methyltransferase